MGELSDNSLAVCCNRRVAAFLLSLHVKWAFWPNQRQGIREEISTVYREDLQFKHARLAFFFLGASASLTALEGVVPDVLFRFNPLGILFTVALTGVDGGLVEDAECIVWCGSEDGCANMCIASDDDRSKSKVIIDEEPLFRNNATSA
jgi:hypothetical protein